MLKISFKFLNYKILIYLKTTVVMSNFLSESANKTGLGINKCKSNYLSTKPIGQFKKSKTFKLLMKGYNFSTNIVEFKKKGKDSEFKFKTDVNVKTCGKGTQLESKSHEFKYLFESTKQFGNKTFNMKYNSCGDLTGWIDWGSNIKGLPNFFVHSRYGLKTNGTEFDVANGITWKKDNLAWMFEFQRGFKSRCFAEKLVYENSFLSLQSHTVYDMENWYPKVYDFMFKLYPTPKLELCVWHKSQQGGDEVYLGKGKVLGQAHLKASDKAALAVCYWKDFYNNKTKLSVGVEVKTDTKTYKARVDSWNMLKLHCSGQVSPNVKYTAYLTLPYAQVMKFKLGKSFKKEFLYPVGVFPLGIKYEFDE